MKTHVESCEKMKVFDEDIGKRLSSVVEDEGWDLISWEESKCDVGGKLVTFLYLL